MFLWVSIFYCHCCTSFNLRILYSFRFTTPGLHFVPILITSFFRSVIAEKVWYMQFTDDTSTQVYCSIHSVPGYQHYQTHQTPDTQSRHLKSVFHFLRQCICEQEGTGIMWWKCSTHYCGIYLSATVLHDEEIGAEYLNVQDVACGTNILTGLVGLVDIFKLVVVWCFDPQLLYCLDQPWKKIQDKTKKYCMKTSLTVTCDSWRKEQ